MFSPQRLVRPAVSNTPLSAIKRMAIRGAARGDVASLSWGLPSFQTPQVVREAVAKALDDDPDIGKYSLPAGMPALRSAVAGFHGTATGCHVDASEHVLITAGNMEGLSVLLHLLLEPGDEIILTDPGFVSHYTQVQLRGAKPVPWPLDHANGWQLQPQRLTELISARTKAILLVTPSNPTGTVFSKEDLIRTADIAMERDLLVLLDDPYSPFVFDDDAGYFNLASCFDRYPNVVYLFTFSKAFAMSGWRLGYMVLSQQLQEQALKVHDATTICAPRISQVAGLAALRDRASHLPAFRTELARRRHLICERLNRLPHVFDYVKPQGAYYVFPRIVAEHVNAETFAIELLDKAGVSVTPGDAFGPSGEHHVRMAFCVDQDVIDQAFDRMEQHFGTV